MVADRESTRFYRLTRWFFRTWFGGLYGMRVQGWENIPSNGGCLLVCNHISNMDPGVLGAAVPHRQIHFMAKRELFEGRVGGAILRAWGAFPVERGHADRQAMRRSLQLLEAGRVVGLFPEGTRSVDGRMGPWHVGMSVLAARARVPVVPAALINTRSTMEERKGWPGGPPITVRFGAPVSLDAQGSPRSALEGLVERARGAVEVMLSEMGCAAGREGNRPWPSVPSEQS